MEATRYRLTLNIDEPALRTRGEVEIELTGCGPEVRLHALGVDVDGVRLDGSAYPFELHPEREEILLSGLPPGSHRVHVSFASPILDKGLIGLYRCPAGDGTLITSMMYPNGARRVFPCIDDPAYKSVFEVTVVADAGSEIVFNTPARARGVVDCRQRVSFEPTPRMSTYLIYLGVGRFGRLTRREDSVVLSALTPPSREADGEFALRHAARVLDGYNRYFGIPYPLPKLDLVSVADFWAGAMENWGAIAFHEVRLLAGRGVGVAALKRIRETVTHEIAHQWFGNLVTMVWWNDFWLNESFATFMQAKLDAQLYPELNVWGDFLLGETRWGFTEDQLPSVHPIEVEVHRPEELGEIADGITYGKGSSVLRMIDRFVGEESFRAGVVAYLKRHAYANARSEDLWHSIEEAAQLPVSRIMSAWVRRPGHPVVTVRREDGGVRFEQQRFTLLGSSSEGAWPIPLTYESGGTVHRVLLDGPSLSIPLVETGPLRVNPDRSGFYRVRYDGPLFTELLGRYDAFDDAFRWGLLTDAYPFMVAGLIPIDQFLSLLRAAAGHPSLLTAGEVGLDHGDLAPLLGSLPTLREGFRDYFRSGVQRLGLAVPPGESEDRRALRSTLVSGAVQLDGAIARELAQGFSDLDRVHPDLRGSTILAYARTEGNAAVDPLRNNLFSASSEELARQLSFGLGAIGGRDRTMEALDVALDPRMPASRTWAMLMNSTRQGSAPDLLWRWLSEHLPTLEKLLAGTPLLSQLVAATAGQLGPGRAAEVRAYFTAHRFAEAERGIARGLEIMEARDRFLTRSRA
jgi:tricorn protease interacting factor F2/3